MDIHVLNEDLQLVGIVDAYTSLIWTTRYFTSGDFELYLPVSEAAVQLLREKYYLCRSQDIAQTDAGPRYKNVMIIERIQITADVENGDHLIVSGRSLGSILYRRILWQQTSLSGTVEDGVRRIVTENAISPAVPERKISRLTLGDALGLTDRVRIQMTGDNLGEAVESMCAAYGYGYDIDVVGGRFVFYLYVGKDRSYAQNERPYVVFSSQFENLSRIEYSHDTSDYKNVAQIAGEGEGKNRKRQYVGGASDLDRYELYVDARDVSTNDGEIADDEYSEMLYNRGLEKLADHPVAESFSGEAETTLTYKPNEDYFLGDIVQVISEYGISAAPRILEIIESDSEEGTSVIPTFSTWEV